MPLSRVHRPYRGESHVVAGRFREEGLPALTGGLHSTALNLFKARLDLSSQDLERSRQFYGDRPSPEAVGVLRL